MRYQVLYTARAQRDIAQLDADTRERIRGAMERCSDRPFEYVRKMAGPTLGMYRVRVGAWRVICDIHEDRIVVLRVGHRREIYRS